MLATMLRSVPAAAGRATLRVALTRPMASVSTKAVAASVAPARAWMTPTKATVFRFGAVVPFAALANMAFCEDDDSGRNTKGRTFRELFFQAKDASPKVPQTSEEAKASFNETLDTAIRNNVPAKIGIGFVCGFAGAFAMKRFFKAAMFVVGTVVILFQGSAYLGWIKVDWENIGQDFGVVFDMDEDGEVGANDIVSMKNMVIKILSANIPGSSGFMTGFLLGLRR